MLLEKFLVKVLYLLQSFNSLKRKKMVLREENPAVKAILYVRTSNILVKQTLCQNQRVTFLLSEKLFLTKMVFKAVFT